MLISAWVLPSSSNVILHWFCQLDVLLQEVNKQYCKYGHALYFNLFFFSPFRLGSKRTWEEWQEVITVTFIYLHVHLQKFYPTTLNLAMHGTKINNCDTEMNIDHQLEDV